MTKQIIIFGAGIATLVLPLAAMAAEALPPGEGWNVDRIVNILNYVVQLIFTILMVVAIAFILWAAFKYLTAMGDPGKITDAHRALLGAAIAIAVALLSTGIRYIVASILSRT